MQGVVLVTVFKIFSVICISHCSKALYSMWCLKTDSKYKFPIMRIGPATLKKAVAILALPVLLAGCKASSPNNGDFSSASSSSAASPSRESQAQRVSTNAQSSLSSQQGKHRMDSQFEEILKAFVGPKGRDWTTYNSLKTIKWMDQRQTTVGGTPAVGATHKREGNLLLLGYSDTDLPDGEVGAEAGSRQGNEGESGLTLLGTQQSVESFAVMKFYASENYSEILTNQFSVGASIQIIANQCGDDENDPEARRFLRLQVPATAEVYVEAYVDAEGGKYSPGSTTFEFYRSEPVDRIEKMSCMKV